MAALAPGSEATLTFNLLRGKRGSCGRRGTFGVSLWEAASVVASAEGKRAAGLPAAVLWVRGSLAGCPVSANSSD